MRCAMTKYDRYLSRGCGSGRWISTPRNEGLKIQLSKIGQESVVVRFFDAWDERSRWPSLTEITSIKNHIAQSV